MPMLKTDKITIGGRVYGLTQLAGKRGLNVWRKLPKHIGPALGRLVTGLLSTRSKEGFDFDGLATTLDWGAVIADIGAALADDEFEALVMIMLSSLTITAPSDGIDSPREFNWDLDLVEHYADLIPLTWGALKLNFSDVFRGPLGLAMLSKLEGAAALRSQSQSTSRGSAPS